MHRIIFLILCLSSFLASAQFYKPQASFDNYYFQAFNSAYLSEHKVKSIAIAFATKEDGQRIQPKGNSKKIQINPSGFPEMEIALNGNDSSQTFYYYVKNKLNIIRMFTTKDIRAVYLGFDSAGNKMKEVHCIEQPANWGNETFDKAFFKLGKQEIDWNETYTYQSLSSSQTRKKAYNDKGIVYKEGIIYSDQSNRITSETERYSITGISENSKYLYDAKGNLTERIFFTDVSGVWEEKSIFTYDELGNIIGEKLYRNGNLLKELVYFYNTKGEFPEAILTKYPDKKTIDMQNITLEFY